MSVVRSFISLFVILYIIIVPSNLHARPVVIELFTSQGCSACPPADSFLGELAQREDIIALSLHVDYWNEKGKNGWKDPYSSSENSKRQKNYNIKNFRTNRNYTPQMVIEGIWEEMGSREDKINLLLLRAKKMAKKPWRNIPIEFTKKDNTHIEVLIGKNLNNSLRIKQNITLFAYDKVSSTKVTRGNNSGKIMDSYNVVKKIYNIGEWLGKEKSIIIDLSKLVRTDKIAVIIQDKNFRNISGANSKILK